MMKSLSAVMALVLLPVLLLLFAPLCAAQVLPPLVGGSAPGAVGFDAPPLADSAGVMLPRHYHHLINDGRYNFNPGLCRDQQGGAGSVHAVYISATGHNNTLDQNVVYRRSLDYGLTWTAPLVLFATEPSPADTSDMMRASDPSISCLSSGRLLAMSTRDGVGHHYVQIEMRYSDDGGLTWSPSSLVDDGWPPAGEAVTMASALEHGGYLYLPIHGRPQLAGNRHIRLLRSGDDGLTWGYYATVADGAQTVPTQQPEEPILQRVLLADSTGGGGAAPDTLFVILYREDTTPSIQRTTSTDLASWTPPTYAFEGRNKPAFVQLGGLYDGSAGPLVAYTRDNVANQNALVRTSHDGGVMWTAPHYYENTIIYGASHRHMGASVVDLGGGRALVATALDDGNYFGRSDIRLRYAHYGYGMSPAGRFVARHVEAEATESGTAGGPTPSDTVEPWEPGALSRALGVLAAQGLTRQPHGLFGDSLRLDLPAYTAADGDTLWHGYDASRDSIITFAAAIPLAAGRDASGAFVRCDASHMEAALPALEQPFTILMVARLYPMSAYRKAFSGLSVPGRVALGVASQMSPAILELMAGASFYGPASVNLGTVQPYEMTVDGDSSMIRVGGVLYAEGNAGANPLAGLTLCAGAGGVDPQRMDLYRLVVVRGRLTPTQRAAWQAYAAQYYGLN